MTKIVIEQSRILFFAIFAIPLVAAIPLFIFFSFRGLRLLLLPPLLLFPLLYILDTYSEKEAIVIEDSGLTLRRNVMVGPIPWDHIFDAEIEGKNLYVYINKRGPEGLLDNSILAKVELNKKTSEQFIPIGIRFCKLRGIDLPAIIKERARGIRIEVSDWTQIQYH